VKYHPPHHPPSFEIRHRPHTTIIRDPPQRFLTGRLNQLTSDRHQQASINSGIIMEQILLSIQSPHHDAPSPSTDLDRTCLALSSLLRYLSQSAVPSTSHPATSSESTASWLYNKCSTISTPLSPIQFTLAVLSASKSNNKEQALFDLFGEDGVEALFEIMAREEEIATITEGDVKAVAGESEPDWNEAAVSTGAMSGHDGSNETEQTLHNLRNEAYELTNLLSTLRQDYLPASSSVGPGGAGTHTVMRKSDKEAEKMYKKALKRAAVAIEKAKESGALTDVDERILLAMKDGQEVDSSQLFDEHQQWNMQNRGLDGMSSRAIELMKRDLLPEGTRVYDSAHNRGLPRDAIRELKEGYEQVIIPAPILDKTKLPKRIVLDQVMDGEERRAFEGTESLNPMQSTVFEAAYLTRENLLICAPTGAGVSICNFVLLARFFICSGSCSLI
jgi:hypothetical protein